MKRPFYWVLALLLIGFFACESDPEPAAAPTTVAPALAPNTLAAPQTNGAVALNPPHGQPGHRCDISVGAPLDGSAAPQAAPQIDMSKVSNGVIMPNAAPAASSGTTAAPNINPAHGQPGHRCDVAVGAPLN